MTVTCGLSRSQPEVRLQSRRLTANFPSLEPKSKIMAESSHAKDNDIGGRLALITGASGGYLAIANL